MVVRLRFALLSISLSLIGFLSGCSQGDRPPIGYVTGKVTIDGQPLSGAIVSFMPEKGRPATGLTDKDGKYELQYTYQVYGCKIGPNNVGFFAPNSGAPSHPIPNKYEKSEFNVDVKKGKNTFDFDLKSDSEPKKAAPKKPVPEVVD